MQSTAKLILLAITGLVLITSCKKTETAAPTTPVTPVKPVPPKTYKLSILTDGKWKITAQAFTPTLVFPNGATAGDLFSNQPSTDRDDEFSFKRNLTLVSDEGPTAASPATPAQVYNTSTYFWYAKAADTAGYIDTVGYIVIRTNGRDTLFFSTLDNNSLITRTRGTLWFANINNVATPSNDTASRVTTYVRP
jgi:hypothetical protein